MIKSTYWDKLGCHNVAFAEEKLKFVRGFAVVGVCYNTGESDEQNVVAKGVIDESGTFVIGPSKAYKKIDILKDGSALVLTDKVHQFDLEKRDGSFPFISDKKFNDYRVVSDNYVLLTNKCGSNLSHVFYNTKIRVFVHRSIQHINEFSDPSFAREELPPVGHDITFSSTYSKEENKEIKTKKLVMGRTLKEEKK